MAASCAGVGWQEGAVGTVSPDEAGELDEDCWSQLVEGWCGCHDAAGTWAGLINLPHLLS